MNFKKISQQRLSSQQISQPKFNTPKELLSWMGAIQAQDFKMAKLAIAARLKIQQVSLLTLRLTMVK